MIKYKLRVKLEKFQLPLKCSTYDIMFAIQIMDLSS